MLFTSPPNLAGVNKRPDLDKLYAKWLARLKRVEVDVLSLHHDRQVWRVVRPALVAASDGSDAFLNHYDRLYVVGSLAGLRRLSDPKKGNASLVRLLDDIASFPDAMSSKRWVDISVDVGEGAFRRSDPAADFIRYASPGTDHVDASRVRADLGRFKNAAKKARTYADKFIAHRDDTDEPVPPVTFGELDMAIDLAGFMFQRYSLLLRATSYAFLEPAIEGDWIGPFRRPLFSAYYRPPESVTVNDPPAFYD
jgi:hypothetical protein